MIKQHLKMIGYHYNKQPKRYKYLKRVLMTICFKLDSDIDLNSILINIIMIRLVF